VLLGVVVGVWVSVGVIVGVLVGATAIVKLQTDDQGPSLQEFEALTRQ